MRLTAVVIDAEVARALATSGAQGMALAVIDGGPIDAKLTGSATQRVTRYKPTRSVRRLADQGGFRVHGHAVS